MKIRTIEDIEKDKVKGTQLIVSSKPFTTLSNKQLYLYGLKSIGVQVLGVLIAIVSLVGALYLIIKGELWWIPLVLTFICGVALWIVGRMMRFDYKVRSGYLVHKGDLVW